MVEVLIAGGGPAGSIAALILARAGIRVLVVDRAAFPRPKLCGDTLNPGAVALLDRLGLGARIRSRGLRVDGMVVTGQRGVAVRGLYPPNQHGIAITRRDLDVTLLEAAAAAGAQVQQRTLVKSPIFWDRQHRRALRGAVLTRPGGTAVRVPACVTIAADGRHSHLAFGLGLARHPRRGRRWAIGQYFQDVHGTSACGEMHIRGGHYIGIATVPGDLVNVCLVTEDRAGMNEPAALLQKHLRADPLLAVRFASARPVQPPSVMGPLAVEAMAAGAPGVLLAGDAAGFVDPMTGDGLRFALRGAELAARAAIVMLERGPHVGYEQLGRWRAAEFGTKHRLNRVLRRIAGSAAAVSLASVTAAIAPAAVRRLINIAGDAA